MTKRLILLEEEDIALLLHYVEKREDYINRKYGYTHGEKFEHFHKISARIQAALTRDKLELLTELHNAV